MSQGSRLYALLGGPDTAWIIERVRHRLEAGHGVEGTLTLRAPTDAQREAVARLFGRRVTSGAVETVRLVELDAMLRRAELCDGIVDAVVQLSGSVTDLRAPRQEVHRQWERLFEETRGRAADRSAVLGWLDDVRATGLVRRLARDNPATGRTLLEQSFAVADLLPGTGISLAELAAAATGDSHALDLGQPVGTLVLRLARALGDRGSEGPDPGRRDVWANVGVLCDELSAPVLALNLRGVAMTPIGQVLSLHADLGEPYRLSTRQLLRSPPDFSAMAGRTVYVCENPSVVAAAANQLGARSGPLVCIEGQIKTAARFLLYQLAAAGASLVYHGDFDWGGIRIGNVVISQCGARPWRFSSADYSSIPAGAPLRGRPVAACWDPELEAVMVASGRSIHEERTLTSLMGDLADDGRPG